MNRSETAKLLAKAALIDNRTIDRNTVEAWHEAIGHQDFADAMDALFMHRQTSTAWLDPAHINALVPVVRRNRATIESKARALTAGPMAAIQGPPEWFREEAGMRTGPKPPAVECPWCGADAHEPCTVRGTDKPMHGSHPSRLEVDA